MEQNNTSRTEQNNITPTEQELALERTDLSHKRTDLSILRTRLAFQNSKLSVEQTHLSYIRTIVSLIGSSAAIYKALPAIGVSSRFSNLLALFLLAFAVFFFVMDRLTYPKLKREIEEMENECSSITGGDRAGSEAGEDE